MTPEIPGEEDVDQELVDIEKIEHYKTNITLWSLFDLGSTLYSIGIVSLVILPLINIVAISTFADIDPTTLIYNTAVVDKSDFQSGASFASTLYFVFILLGNIIIIVLSPLIGAFADQLEQRKFLLTGLAFTSILCVSLISLRLNLIWIIAFYFFANLIFSMALVLYESMIPFVAKPNHTSKVSSIGLAVGYIGSLVAILVSEVFKQRSPFPNYILDENSFQIQIGYIQTYIPVIAVLFALFTVPLLFVKEGRHEPEAGLDDLEDVMENTYEKMKKTLYEMWHVDDSRYFLIGWLLFIDVVNVATLYLSVIITLGLGLPSSVVNTVLLIGIVTAIILTYPIGILGDKYGPHLLIKLVSVMWLTAISLVQLTNLSVAGFTFPDWLIYPAAFLMGPALGGTFTIPRQMLSEISPAEKMSNYFAVANIFSRVSTIIGPAIVFITINVGESIGIGVSTSYRIVIILVAAVMILGIHFLTKMDDRHDDFLDGYRHVGEGRWKRLESN